MDYALIAPAMVIINAALKKVGMPSKFAPLMNIVGGTLLGLLIAACLCPEGALMGLVAGLGGGGLYDTYKLAKPKIDEYAILREDTKV